MSVRGLPITPARVDLRESKIGRRSPSCIPGGLVKRIVGFLLMAAKALDYAQIVVRLAIIGFGLSLVRRAMAV